MCWKKLNKFMWKKKPQTTAMDDNEFVIAMLREENQDLRSKLCNSETQLSKFQLANNKNYEQNMTVMQEEILDIRSKHRKCSAKRDKQIEEISNELEEQKNNVCKLKLKIEEIDNDKMVMMNETKKLSRMVKQLHTNIDTLLTDSMKKDKQIEAILNELEERKHDMCNLKHKIEKIDNDKIIGENEIKKLSRMVKQSDINIGYILTDSMKRDKHVEAISNELEERNNNVCKLKHKIEKMDNDKKIMVNEIKKLSRMIKESDKNIEYIRTEDFMKRDKQIEAIFNRLEERKNNTCKLKLKIEELDNDKIIMVNEIKKLSRMVKQSNINTGCLHTGENVDKVRCIQWPIAKNVVQSVPRTSHPSPSSTLTMSPTITDNNKPSAVTSSPLAIALPTEISPAVTAINTTCKMHQIPIDLLAASTLKTKTKPRVLLKRLPRSSSTLQEPSSIESGKVLQCDCRLAKRNIL